MESGISHSCSPRSSCQPPAEDWWRTSAWAGSSLRVSPVTTATTWRATGCSRPRRARGSTFTLRRWRWPRTTTGERETHHVCTSCSTSAKAMPLLPRKTKITHDYICVRACGYPLENLVKVDWNTLNINEDNVILWYERTHVNNSAVKRTASLMRGGRRNAVENKMSESEM